MTWPAPMSTCQRAPMLSLGAPMLTLTSGADAILGALMLTIISGADVNLEFPYIWFIKTLKRPNFSKKLSKTTKYSKYMTKNSPFYAIKSFMSSIPLKGILIYLHTTIWTARTMEIWKSGTAWYQAVWYQAAAWSIRHHIYPHTHTNNGWKF